MAIMHNFIKFGIKASSKRVHSHGRLRVGVSFKMQLSHDLTFKVITRSFADGFFC